MRAVGRFIHSVAHHGQKNRTVLIIDMIHPSHPDFEKRLVNVSASQLERFRRRHKHWREYFRYHTLYQRTPPFKCCGWPPPSTNEVMDFYRAEALRRAGLAIAPRKYFFACWSITYM